MTTYRTAKILLPGLLALVCAAFVPELRPDTGDATGLSGAALLEDPVFWQELDSKKCSANGTCIVAPVGWKCMSRSTEVQAGGDWYQVNSCYDSRRPAGHNPPADGAVTAKKTKI